MDEPPKVFYAPRMLTSMREICREFATTERCVLRWIKQGAPIIVRGAGKGARYLAEVMQLHSWILYGNRKNR